MTINFSKLERKLAVQTEQIAARIDPITKEKLELIKKSQNIKSVSILLYALIKQFVSDYEEQNGELKP